MGCCSSSTAGKNGPWSLSRAEENETLCARSTTSLPPNSSARRRVEDAQIGFFSNVGMLSGRDRRNQANDQGPGSRVGGRESGLYNLFFPPLVNNDNDVSSDSSNKRKKGQQPSRTATDVAAGDDNIIEPRYWSKHWGSLEPKKRQELFFNQRDAVRKALYLGHGGANRVDSSQQQLLLTSKIRSALETSHFKVDAMVFVGVVEHLHAKHTAVQDGFHLSPMKQHHRGEKEQVPPAPGAEEDGGGATPPPKPGTAATEALPDGTANWTAFSIDLDLTARRKGKKNTKTKKKKDASQGAASLDGVAPPRPPNTLDVSYLPKILSTADDDSGPSPSSSAPTSYAECAEYIVHSSLALQRLLSGGGGSGSGGGFGFDHGSTAVDFQTPRRAQQQDQERGPSAEGITITSSTSFSAKSGTQQQVDTIFIPVTAAPHQPQPGGHVVEGCALVIFSSNSTPSASSASQVPLVGCLPPSTTAPHNSKTSNNSNKRGHPIELPPMIGLHGSTSTSTSRTAYDARQRRLIEAVAEALA